MTNNSSRSYNLLRNVTATLIAQVVILLISFVNRTIFIKLLGAEYLGIDGLFGSILTVLSLAELGLGSAIIFNLYKPIADGDTEKAKQYISFYAKAYNAIIAVVLAAGLLLLPFLKLIINSDDIKVNVNLYAVYLLFLVNTVSSYFLAHRQAVLVVNQRQSTVSAVQMSVKIAALTAESVILLVFGNYYLYLASKVIANYIQAVIISILAKRKYPDLCVKSQNRLSKNELSVVKKNVSALFIRRIGSIVLSSTDNLIINGFISTVMVGVYSNYTLIVSSVQTVTVQLFSAMTATIGNYVASKKKENVEKLFRVYTYAIYLVYGFCCICLYTLTNRFILLLWGKEYLLSELTLLIIVVNFFFYGFQAAVNVFRDTTGLFVQGKYRVLISAAVNVIFSLLLVKPLGISGVILATVVSRVAVSAWFDPFILYRHYFKGAVSGYYIRVLLYTAVTLALCLLSDFLSGFFGFGIIGFLAAAFVSVLCSGLLLLPFIRTKESKELFKRITDMFGKIMSKVKNQA